MESNVVSISNKQDLLQVKDFPRSEYTVYWETRVVNGGEYACEFGCRLVGYDGLVHDEIFGGGDSVDDCLDIVHKWLRAEMPKYKRG